MYPNALRVRRITLCFSGVLLCICFVSQSAFAQMTGNEAIAILVSEVIEPSPSKDERWLLVLKQCPARRCD